jgi:hypothetical protein
MPIKISGLAAQTTLKDVDLVPVVDDPAGVDTTKKITAANARAYMTARTAIRGSGDLLASLPYFAAAMADYNDNTAATLTVLSLGSSVGQGGGLSDPTNQAPGAYFTSVLNAKLNKLGNYTIQHYNGCQNGTAMADLPANWNTAIAAATGTTVIVPIFMGMNDGLSPSYHSGQTYPGARTFIKQITQTIRKAHADPVFFTTPHPNSALITWSLGGGPGSSSYPAAGVQKPDATTAQSIKTITTVSGASVAVSYRHLRHNELVRRTCAEVGVTCIDAERYWFEAIAANGEAALFGTGETVHPNLLGHQLSYWAAIDDWARSFETAHTESTPPNPIGPLQYDELYNIQIASPLHITTFIDQQYGILSIRAAHGGVAARQVSTYLCLGDYNGGTGSGVRIVQLGTLAGNLFTVSTSGYDVVVTVVFDGTTVAWTLFNGFPLP